MLTNLLVLMILILFNAFFAASEIALISLNDNKLRLMAEDGHKKAKLLMNLLGDPSRFLATIQIGITLAGFLASAFASESFAEPIVKVLIAAGVPIPEAILHVVAVVVITLILSYFTLVLGELVPKRLAMQKADSIAMFAAGPLSWLSLVASPFVRFLTASTNFFVRLCGVDPNAQQEQVTEEEIRMMVDVGEEKGAIHETEKEMINNIFEFNNTLAGEIMTHRTEIAGIRYDADFQEIARMVNREKFTRYPIYQDDIDHIVGVLHVKDLLAMLDCGTVEGFSLSSILRKPYYVPESKRIDEMFRDMKKNKTHLAVVIDEYGGTAGIITIEDLLEEIVGSITDEYDEEEKDVERLEDGTFVLDGGTSLERVAELLETELPVDDFDTVSGFVIGQLGRFPEQGENPVVEHGTVVFTVESMEEKRITRVHARRKTEEWTGSV